MLDQALLEDAMRRALVLAARGPAPDPNPQVGCVLLGPDGRIVAEGWHHGSGTPHAEIEALAVLPAEWRGRAGALTAVVTLEPCNHTGRTGPCARALLDSGIGAVVYALDDPGAQSGGGAATLREAGVAVRGGVLSEEARALVAPWLARQDPGPRPSAHGAVTHDAPAPEAAAPGSAPRNAPAPETRARPHVVAKWAQTLDGRAAAADGSSQWITGPDARADVHRRRAEADAILVGTGTLLADDPALTARAADGTLLVPAGEQPIPIVLGRRPIPEGARVLAHPALAARGLTAPIRLAGDDLAADLAELARLGVRRLFVEGGPTVTSALFAAGLVDEVLVYVAPTLLGGSRLALSDLGVPTLGARILLDVSETLRLGDDLLVRAAVHAAPDPVPHPRPEKEQ